MVDFHKDNADVLNLPELYSIDDVVAIFAAQGFDVAVARLPMTSFPWPVTDIASVGASSSGSSTTTNTS